MDVFVARQPIFDRKQRVVAYELLFRKGLESVFEATDGDAATSQVVFNSFVSLGIDSIADGQRAFVNFTGNLLKQGLPKLLPHELLVVEILETVEPEPEIIEACRQLKMDGYWLALDDFVFHPRFQPLIDLADIIKIDFLATDVQERVRIANQFKGTPIRLLAEKVETQEDFKQAMLLGYTYFQGYFFSKPVVIAAKDVPMGKYAQLQLIREVNQPDMDVDNLERIVQHDLALMYKLLKYVNSSAFGFRMKIHSVRQAIALLGQKELAKLASLFALRILGEDKPPEILKVSAVRARFGELLAREVGLKARMSDAFFMGMFSMIDVLLGRPMDEVLAGLPVAEEVRLALKGQGTSFRDIYGLVLAYERGAWTAVCRFTQSLQLDERVVADLYKQALQWAHEFSVGE
ncbi:MAG TPA: HDOD domain-containing protein [Patescibacteria group bacterium]|nr:HDOD domain-containing protein [Patescibacteria group bacterium]